MHLIQYSPNIDSAKLIKKVIDTLSEHGLSVQEFHVKIYDVNNNLLFLNVKNVPEIEIAYNNLILTNPTFEGTNLTLLYYMEITNNNLLQYNNKFVVNMENLSPPKIWVRKLRDISRQDKINREVDRYKLLIDTILNDYETEFKVISDAHIQKNS